MSLIILVNQADPIARALARQAQVISVADFLQDGEVFDQISTSTCEICWQIGESTIRNTDNTLLLNRITHLGLHDLADFAEADRLYALLELRSYFGFALANFQHLNYHISSDGIEKTLPLPNQWQIIGQAGEVATPAYYWGDYRFNHLAGADLVYGDIYQFHRWRANQPVPRTLQFCYKRPAGLPYFALCIGDRVMITPYKPDQPVPPATLASLAVRCSHLLQLYIAELLFFVEGDTLCFAYAAPIVTASCVNPAFNDFCQQSLLEVADAA